MLTKEGGVSGDLDLLEPSLAVWGLGGVHLVHSDKDDGL